MSTTESFASRLERQLTDAIKACAEFEKEELIKKAVAEFEVKLRKAVGTAAIQLANYYNVERMGTDLVIRVRVDSAVHR